jgi:ABC-type sugar transport system permease subunit
MKSRPPHPAWAPWIFLSPFLLFFTAFAAWPLVRSFMLAFEQTFGPRTTAYVGLLNFRFLIHDPLFWVAVRNTAFFTLGTLAIQVPAALALALLLNRPGLRGRTFFRLVFFSPTIVGSIFVGVIFSLLLEKRSGLVNTMLHAVFRSWNPDFPWVDGFVMPSLLMASLWLSVGFNMAYLLAALQNVPGDQLDAAAIDGANTWQRFRHVTLPAIQPVISILVLLTVAGALQLFDLPFILYADSFGNGPNNAALSIVTYLYQTGFRSGDLGYASALGWVLTIVLVLIALVYRWLTRKEEIAA